MILWEFPFKDGVWLEWSEDGHTNLRFLSKGDYEEVMDRIDPDYFLK